MADDRVHRLLVPNPPPHRRTERDEVPELVMARRGAAAALRFAEVRNRPGITEPRLVSSYDGSIDRLLVSFPRWALDDPRLVAGYRSVIGALRPGTRFVVVCTDRDRTTVREWFDAAGHKPDDVTFAPMPGFVEFTDWAEDAYVALTDGDDPAVHLVEPWEFLRAGDALIADTVEEHTTVKATQAPLVFQGGNCLIGDDFWLLGTDYFADTMRLVEGGGPVTPPEGADPAEFVRGLFGDFLDSRRRLVLVGVEKPLSPRPFHGRAEDGAFFLDIPFGGIGTLQPIFHIDMFVTLVGRGADGRFEILVGDPAAADEALGTTSPYSLASVYDRIAASLEGEGFRVHRNPIAHVPDVVSETTLADLIGMLPDAAGSGLEEAVAELQRAGAGPDAPIPVRVWTDYTWNNCLVENSASVGRNVYLPTYGQGDDRRLELLDAMNTELWEQLGFTVHQLGDFGAFATRLGVVHCIKKYLERGA